MLSLATVIFAEHRLKLRGNFLHRVLQISRRRDRDLLRGYDSRKQGQDQAKQQCWASNAHRVDGWHNLYTSTPLQLTHLYMIYIFTQTPNFGG